MRCWLMRCIVLTTVRTSKPCVLSCALLNLFPPTYRPTRFKNIVENVVISDL